MDGGGPTQRPAWIPDEQWAYSGYDRLIRPELSLLWGKKLKDRDDHRKDVQERLNRFPDYWTKDALSTTTTTATAVLKAPTVSESSSTFLLGCIVGEGGEGGEAGRSILCLQWRLVFLAVVMVVVLLFVCCLRRK